VKKTGFTVWFTGLPFSGKKQLAALLSTKLKSRGYKTKILDGGRIRREFNRKLGYSRDDVFQNIRRIAFECQMLTENGIVAIAVTISPYKELRDECRLKIKRYIEIFCDCPLEILKQRDSKGLYRKAEEGKLKDVAGISVPFEPPEKPEVHLYPCRESFEQSLAKTLRTFEMLGFIEKSAPCVLTEEEESMIRQRLRDMGYL